MICCLNPDCSNPLNSGRTNFCESCGTELVSLLRGRYRIIKPLGGGGFARTYLAEDIDKLDEECVVKQLVPQVQGGWLRKKATELFHQEAKRLQQLGEHPQIPSLYAYFQEDDYQYLVQQFIKGQDLLQELKQHSVFDEAKIRELLSDLLPILATVHQQHVIHRDLKLENIIRRESDSKLVLIDFGGSKHKTAKANRNPGTNIGSFGYAPFEQLRAGEAYPASDLYSLGVICFYLLTDIYPWELLLKQGYSWTTSWREHLTQPISQELGLIIDKLLQENHELRYQSAEAVLQDLNTLPPSGTPLTMLSPLQPLTLQPQIQEQSITEVPIKASAVQQPPQYLPQFSTKELLPRAVITASGSSFLAIALLSFIGTVWISASLWVIILALLIFAQSRSTFEKTYLFTIAVVTTLFIFFVYQNFTGFNPLQAGIRGMLFVVLLIILAGLLAFTLMVVSQILNRFISSYF